MLGTKDRPKTKEATNNIKAFLGRSFPTIPALLNHQITQARIKEAINQYKCISNVQAELETARQKKNEAITKLDSSKFNLIKSQLQSKISRLHDKTTFLDSVIVEMRKISPIDAIRDKLNGLFIKKQQAEATTESLEESLEESEQLLVEALAEKNSLVSQNKNTEVIDHRIQALKSVIRVFADAVTFKNSNISESDAQEDITRILSEYSAYLNTISSQEQLDNTGTEKAKSEENILPASFVSNLNMSKNKGNN